MNVIRINAQPNGKYYEWRTEAKRLLGLPEDASACLSSAPCEFAWNNGVLYKRNNPEPFFNLVNFGHETLEGDPLHVMCTCGCTGFILRRGGYQLWATCSECGKEGLVYEG